MKTTELMIGDWVYDNELKRNGKVAKIDYDGEDDIIEPIPITEEILKKNGFVLKRDGVCFPFCSFTLRSVSHGSYVFGGITLEYIGDARHNDAYWAFSCVNKKCDVSLIAIHYVHELQHALKIAGIKLQLNI